MADDPDLVARRDGDDPEKALPTGDCAELLELHLVVVVSGVHRSVTAHQRTLRDTPARPLTGAGKRDEMNTVPPQWFCSGSEGTKSRRSGRGRRAGLPPGFSRF